MPYMWGNHAHQWAINYTKKTQRTVRTNIGELVRCEMCGNEGRGVLPKTYNDVGGQMEYLFGNENGNHM